MDFFTLLAVLLGGIAIFLANSAKRRAEDAHRLLRDASAEIGALDRSVTELRKLVDAAGAARSEPEPERTAPGIAKPVAPRDVPREPPPVVHEEPVFARPSAPAPAPPPISRAAKAKNLEETLTSRWLVWLGALAIMLAGTFLVRYAIDHGLLGPAARVTLGFLLGLALIFAGEWLRQRPLERAIAAVRTNQVPPALTASGLFTAFASVYAAYALYNLLPPLVAFAGLAFVALLGVGLSLLQGRFVALMGLLGAFAAPAMVTAQDPSVWTLFAYLLVVEIACLAVARYKAWWWFAFATLAGAAVWPFLWMLDSHRSSSDALPLGLFLLLTAASFFALRRGVADPEGQEDWLQEVRAFAMPEWVVWVAACATAFVLFAVVSETGYCTTGLVFAGLIAVLFLFVGRRHGIFDSLAVVAAVLVLVIAATMPMPAVVIWAPAVHRPPLVPVELQYFYGACVAFGALFGISGFAALWGAKRPALWAAVSAAVPIFLLVIAYYRVAGFGVDFEWAFPALALAAVSLFAAERVERYRAARGLEVTLAFYAAAVVALVSLAAAMSLREAWLTVALSIQLPALAWIATRIRTRSLEVIAGMVAVSVLVRLVFNDNIFSYALATNPAASWVVYGYGIPAISFFLAARLFRPLKAEQLVMLLEAGGLAFSVLLVSMEIRLFIAGSLVAPEYGLLEQSLQSIAWLAVGSALAMHFHRKNNQVSFYGAAILLGVAAAQVLLLQLLFSNPMWTSDSVGTYPVLNVLLLAYAVPAAFAFRVASTIRQTKYAGLAQYADIAGYVLVFAYVTLEVTRAFEGPVFHWARHGNAELYTYSVVWLAYAVALLALGIAFGKSLLRFASLAVLVVTALKVFLVDMAGLPDLYRVASFLGLGLSLVGIGFIYQRFVFPRPAVKEGPEAPAQS